MKQDRLFFPDKESSNWLDERVFNQLFDQYWKKLFGFCRHYVQDADASKEIVQQVFLSLWERREQLDIKVNIANYLFGAVRLRIAHYFREESYRQSKMTCTNQEFCDTTNNTEEIIHFEDLNRYVETLILKLPCRCRQVYTLSRQKGLTIPEIAEKLDISVKTTEAHLTKALKFLRTQIELTEA